MTQENNDLMKHLIEASKMQADIENLKVGQHETNSRVIALLGELAGDIKGLRVDLQNVPDKISVCRREMRREIEQDFPNKLEALQMEQRIEEKISETDKTLGVQISELDKKIDKIEVKFDKQWVKITAIVLTIVALGGVIQWFLVTSRAVLG